jgi:flagellar basal body-associated protein FliL
MPDEEPQVTAPANGSRSKKLMTGLILVAIMAAEGGLIFAGMKMFGAGASSSSAGEVEREGEGGALSDDEDKPRGELAEVLLADTDAFNNRSGRLYVYHIQVTGLVKAVDKERVEQQVETRQATIRDRINTIIRGADPQHLNEPGLETLRRQIQFELNEVLGDDSLVLELLIPKLLQSRTSL